MNRKLEMELNTPINLCIQQIFEATVLRTPDKTAVVLPEIDQEFNKSKTVSYYELNKRANHLAHILLRKNVGPDILVAMFMDRSIEMIVAILGILKAGGSYVPIDPAYPKERIDFMLKDTGSPVLLTQSHFLSRLTDLKAEIQIMDAGWGSDLVSENKSPECKCTSENLAYINYTSGSTGTPKGVMVPHRGVIRLVFGVDYTPLNADQVLLQLATISFDAATFEIWGALLHGGKCVLYPGNGIPDLKILKALIENYKITTMWLTASLFNTIIDEKPDVLLNVNEILTGGEALSVTHVKKAQNQLPGTNFVNGYGPTENTTFTCCYRIPSNLDKKWLTIPIGQPISNTTAYILDSKMQIVDNGESGELYVGGYGVAKGYLNRPELTAEKFIKDRFSKKVGATLYATGDNVRRLPDGNIDFLGRVDDQVKIHGYRIEPKEIEFVLKQNESLSDALVVVREDKPGQKKLVAYVILSGQKEIDSESLREYLRDKISVYMIPAFFVFLDKIPLTANGKTDRQALPKPKIISKKGYSIPTNSFEKELSKIWSQVLDIENIGTQDNFFDVGGSSILSLKVVLRIKDRIKTDRTISVVKFFQYPTIKSFADYLTQESSLPFLESEKYKLARQRINQKDSSRSITVNNQFIAIIGMAGRFPGASNVEKLWENICNGKESITFFDEEDLSPTISSKLKNDSNYVKARGVLDDIDMFDASFFGISPREAEIMDPQQRLFLELSWEALDNSGYTPEQYNGLIGIFAGSNNNTYYLNNVLPNREAVDRIGEFQAMLVNEKDFLTTRVSYKLDLSGPSVNIYTACSTSLVAVCHAFDSLNNYQCDMALAGGISIIVPQNSGYLYQEGAILSKDGHCRPFDKNAHGVTFNSGAGIVVLKRLDDAIRDGDEITAVIRGTGMNNDGADKVSFTSPSINGQAKAVSLALAQANVSPETISYIETHGTGTPLGDPIEIAALNQVFKSSTSARQFCAIGSIKSNIGHLIHASGVTGLIKTALSLKNKKIPPSLNFSESNPEIDFESSPFYVNTRLTEWENVKGPRRAGVSAFGVGGTNAHVVLEEAPEMVHTKSTRSKHLLVISAKTDAALKMSTKNIHKCLSDNPEIEIADVANTLMLGRKTFNLKRFIICKDVQDALRKLEEDDCRFNKIQLDSSGKPDVVFMFPGQGSQYINMGLKLYEAEPVFRKVVDECSEILKSISNIDIRSIIFPVEKNSDTATEELIKTKNNQPALFIIEYALAKLWNSWGVFPSAMIGHSIGEYVAACLSGVFSLENALLLASSRGRLMQEQPEGSMLSVRMPLLEIEKRLGDNLSIAAMNAPSLCVVSGPSMTIFQLQKELEKEKIICRLLHTSHAFHSSMMEPAIKPFKEIVKAVELSSPQLPFISAVSGTWITQKQAIDPEYWANHLRQPVRFADGIKEILKKENQILLETGPGNTATTLAFQQIKDKETHTAIPSLGRTTEGNSEWTAILQAVGILWKNGIPIDWKNFYKTEKRNRIPLPPYPFERKRFWLDSYSSLADQSATENSNGDQKCFSEFSNVVKNVKEPCYMVGNNRREKIIHTIHFILEEISGEDVSKEDESVSFLEMGFDSLILTQVSVALKNEFKSNISIRQLMEDYPDIEKLAEYYSQTLPVDFFPEENKTDSEMINMKNSPQNTMQNFSCDTVSGIGTVETLISHQLRIMELQLRAIGGGSIPLQPPAIDSPTMQLKTSVSSNDASNIQMEQPDGEISKARHTPGTRIAREKIGITLTKAQDRWLNEVMKNYQNKFNKSKQHTQKHRKYFSDPRTVSGFNPEWKEIIFPIVTEKSKGSKLWDIDGNELIDISNGFGPIFFGHSPDFITKAIKKQLDLGIETGPQAPLAGEVAKLFCELTGNERCSFASTGSEAVIGAIRLARTVTCRQKIVMFEGSYHGIFDEVINRPGKNYQALPAAPGISKEMTSNMLVLPWGGGESLDIIKKLGPDLAAVLVEPVQSRHPEFHDREYLQSIRKITQDSGTAMILDEVVTGFRVHPGGIRKLFDIDSDLATYGKVVGGGYPIGIIGGKVKFMDALDGGYWQYGDESIPECGVTFFAGTFVRHPLALAAANAVLMRIKAEGNDLYKQLGEKTSKLALSAKDFIRQLDCQVKFEEFASFFYISVPQNAHWGHVLFLLMVMEGINIQQFRPNFITTAHSDEDISAILTAFKKSLALIVSHGLIEGNMVVANKFLKAKPNLPPGAKLGKNARGEAAYFINDPKQKGKYLEVGKP